MHARGVVLLSLLACSSALPISQDGAPDVRDAAFACEASDLDGSASPWPDQPCPCSIPSPSDDDARIAALKTAIKTAMLMPQAKPFSPLFNGNVDWHSSVHAHWALLTLARVTNDPALEDFMQARLTDAALANEQSLLNNPMNSQSEIPYGQSWLLLLLAEQAKRPSRNTASLKQFRLDTEARIFLFLDNQPFPELTNNNFLGDHYSWLFSYLLTEMSAPITANATQHLAMLRAKKIEPARQYIPNMIPGPTDFLYIPAVPPW